MNIDVLLFVCSDKGSDDSKTLEVLEQMGLAPSTVSKSDVAVIREVTALMSRRGAYIIASGNCSEIVFVSILLKQNTCILLI